MWISRICNIRITCVCNMDEVELQQCNKISNLYNINYCKAFANKSTIIEFVQKEGILNVSKISNISNIRRCQMTICKGDVEWC